MRWHRGVFRERCLLFTRLIPFARAGIPAPTAETIGKDYATVQTLDELRALADTLTAAGVRVPQAPTHLGRCAHRRHLL